MIETIAVNEDMAGAYENAGKELWIYQGWFSKNKFHLDVEEKLTIFCETNKMYCTVSENDNQQFIPISKTLEYGFCCPYTIKEVDVFVNASKEVFEGEFTKTLQGRVCLEWRVPEIATEMLVDAFKKFIKEHNIDGYGL